ncbi:conserved hypothetical protein [Cenarchaeum symbiosum A]|uniref:Phosphoribosylformylglycinamidine synthase subunit PurS n=1 Tax=Cenarchaeum symbiosum (strain A) TaxID=414004 RepID=A0RUH2_CENSY|nr:conserved hypothetical protein [Cenarchaeum symbiosum A]
MPEFEILVTIGNKPGISDPEGDTILKDLVLRGGYKTVSRIRTAKTLKFTITEETKEEAIEAVKKACDGLRIYNPLVSAATIRVSGA